MIESDGVCKGCGAPAVPFGLFCAGCYGQILHPEGLPLEPGDPADPYREFNAEADAGIMDRQMPKWMIEPPPRPQQARSPYEDELRNRKK